MEMHEKNGPYLARLRAPMEACALRRLTCLKCGGEWIVRQTELDALSRCPFCGGVLRSTVARRPEQTLGGALYTALRALDFALPEDPSTLDRAMTDFAPARKKEIRLFCRAVCEPHADVLRTALTAAEPERPLRTLREALVGEEGLSDAWADLFCGAVRDTLALRAEPETELSYVREADYCPAPRKKPVSRAASKNAVQVVDGMKIQNGVLLRYTGKKSVAVVPDTVTRIGKEAFADCQTLLSIELPDSVEEIGEGAFSGCISLAGIRLPANLEEIPRNAFARCRSLTRIEMPEKLKRVGPFAFDNCNALTSVVFPSSLEKIGDFAFHSCYGLKSVSVPYSAEVSGYAFTSTKVTLIRR